MSDLQFPQNVINKYHTHDKCSEFEKLTTFTKLFKDIEEAPTEVDCRDLIDIDFVNLMRCTLKSSESKFVQYMAQKAFTAYLKRTCCEEGLNLLQEILNDSFNATRMCCGLQICRKLLSKDCCHRYHIFKMLNSSIYNVFTLPFTSTRIKNSDLDQHFYENCSLLVKVAKMFLSQNEEDGLVKFLKKILLSEYLCDILFHISLKHYVKSKLIQFLCLILKPNCIKGFRSIQQEKVTTSSVIFQQLCSRDIQSLYISKGTRTFIGMQCTDTSHGDTDDIDVNIAHVREWTLLAFSVASCLISSKENLTKVEEYLSEMNVCLQRLFKQKSSLPFPWLPDVYSEQDDIWIDVLLLIIDIYPIENGSSDNSSCRWQHHMHFLKFIGILGYDHLVLIDLLTSPETNCLLYFTKYLKILQNTWYDFVHVTKLLTSEMVDSRIVDPTSNACDVDKTKSHDISVHQNASVDLLIHSSSQKSDGDAMENTKTENEQEMEIDNSDRNQNDSEDIKNLPMMQIGAIINDSRSMKSNGDKIITDSACKSGGLTLLANAYDDDSDESSDGFDDENEDNVDTAIDNLKSYSFDDNGDSMSKENCVRSNDDINADGVIGIECDGIEDLNVDSLNVNDCDVDDVSDKFDDDDDNYNDINDYDEKNDDDESNYEADYYHGDDGDNYDSNDDDDDDFDIAQYRKIMKKLSDDTDTKSKNDNELLDKTMSMLIRTRLKLDTLRESGLILYNPNVLIQFLSSIEVLYENN
ncbi:Protein bli-3 [Mactra antiquata]